MPTLNNDPGIACPNANWNGVSTNYCSNVTGDETMAHEWGHAYTEYTSELIYQWQSGTLNESYSDLWGEVVDLLNGRGIDAPDVEREGAVCSSNIAGANFSSDPTVDTVRWLSGEDDPAFFNVPVGSGNAIRDLWNPACFGDPGSVTSDNYHCAASDSGGVHTNSGVPNRAFALMVDGDSGLGIDALGITKAAHIEWAAQNMLTAASDFVDNADALEAACTSLIGADLPELSTTVADAGLSDEMIDAADCTEVTEIIAEVEFETAPD
jgi:Zn-dependent metalloprotease